METGFYWVRIDNDDNWIVARYFSVDKIFYLTGVEEAYDESEFYDICYDRITPP